LVQEDAGEIKCKGLESADGICPEGKIPALSADNYELWGLFQRMMPGLLGSEGYDYSAIQVVFDIHDIEQSRRPDFLRRIAQIIKVVDEERRKKRGKG